MSTPLPPKPAKLVIGLFLAQKALFDAVTRRLQDCFGPVDLVSGWLPFDYTDYYAPEMGSPLFRRMLAFGGLIEQNRLAHAKTLTNAIEGQYAVEHRRRVNLDPGYLLLERFVLATGKNYTHRIYQDDGIYADLTLIYQSGAFHPLPWTYPDYQDPRLIEFLKKVRNKYSRDLKQVSQ